MWLLTPEGFYSVVQQHGEEDLCVRARVAADLDRLREGVLRSLSPTMETPAGDYRYRAWATHEAVGEALAQIARDLHYDNFKNEVSRHDRERGHLYHDVWAVLGRLQVAGGGEP
jgi:hypothetical protein